MANRRKNSGPRSPNLNQNQYEQQNAANAAAAKPESVQINESIGISKTVNDKVMNLINGIAGIRKFDEEHAENGEYNEFFEANREKIDALLTLELNETYQQLVSNGEARKRLYIQLIQQGAISQAELEEFLGKVSTQPYQNAIAHIKAHKNAPQPLNEEDVDSLENATTRNFQIIINRLKSENKLTDAEITKLQNLGPKTDEELTEARTKIEAKLLQYDIVNKTTFQKQLSAFARREKQLEFKIDSHIDQYNEIFKQLSDEISENLDDHGAEKERADRLKAIRGQTGLPIDKGAVFYGEDWTFDPMNTDVDRPRNNKVEITNITYGLDEEDGDLYPQFQARRLTFEPVFHFKTTTKNGLVQEHKLSAVAFKSWLVNNNVAEKIENAAQLEQTFGLKTFIQPGQTFQYITLSPSGSSAPPIENIRSVKLLSINGDVMEFDQPLILDPASKSTGLEVDRKSKKVKMGDFARWYRRNDVVPAVEVLERADNFLAQYHNRFNKQMGWPEGTGTPINLSKAKPIYLMSAYQPDAKHFEEIVSTDDGKITFADGEELTPSEFLHKVIQQGLFVPTKEQMDELQAAAAHQENATEEAKMKELNEKIHPTDVKTTTQAPGAPSAKPPRQGYFKSLWNNTHFLSLMEAYELFIKAPTERIKEYFKDQSERKVATVGKNFWQGNPIFGLNDLAGRYEAKFNGKIGEDVKKKIEFYENNKPIEDVFKILYGTANSPDPIVLKATLEVLAKKGLLRWEDDLNLQKAVNAHFPDTIYPAKFDRIVGKGALVDIGDKNALSKGVTIFDQFRAKLDGKYGIGAFDSINGSNERQYQTEKEAAGKNMRKYEMFGGIEYTLKKMLSDFQNGIEVNEAEFDGLLAEAISELEVNIEQGMLLLISAFGMRRKDGRTLLSYSRLEPYPGKLGHHFMFLHFSLNTYQYDENNKIIREPDGTYKKKKFNMSNFRHIFDTVIKKDMETAAEEGKTGMDLFKAGKHTINWIMSDVVTDDKIKEKVANKGTGSAKDKVQQYLGPMLWTDWEIKRALKTTEGSQPNTLAVKNGYAGYNNQLLIRANKLNKGVTEADKKIHGEEFAEMVFGFTYFNNILRGRIKKNGHYLTLDESQYNSFPNVDKLNSVSKLATESENFVKELATEISNLSGDDELKDLTREILLSGSDTLDEIRESKFRNKLLATIMAFNADPAMRPRLAEIAVRLSRKNLEGMSGVGRTKAESIEAGEEEANED